MRYLISALVVVLAVIVPALSQAEPITISWTAPTLNADGTPLTDLDGYTVYWGQQSRGADNAFVYPNQAQTTQTTLTIPDLALGTWYFAVTASDLVGNESVYSMEATATLSTDSVAPGAPSQILCIATAVPGFEVNVISVSATECIVHYKVAP